jgi:signal transduction histidine kinase/DNA-binding response OmpR family regulator/ligand-binding sensor domain-containing protein
MTEMKVHKILKTTGKSYLFVFTTTIVFLLCSAAVLAVKPYKPNIADPLLESWRWQHFPELDGRGFICMAQAGDGTMWFGLRNGVISYDGISWTDYTAENGAPKNSINTICPARDGTIYFGSESDITVLSGGKWKQLFPSNSKLGGIVNKIIQTSDETIWAGISYGILRTKNNKPVFYTSNATKVGLQQLMPDIQIVIVPDMFTKPQEWADGVGILQIDGVITFLAEKGTAKKAGLEVGDHIIEIRAASGDCSIEWGYISSNLQSIDSDAVSDFVAGELTGKPGSVFELTVQKANQSERIKINLECVEIEETYPIFDVYEIYQDSKDSIWFGLSYGPIIQQSSRSYDYSDFSNWRIYTEKDGLKKLTCPRILQSRGGRIWAGSILKTAELNMLDPANSKWTNFQLSDIGGADECNSIIETEDGVIWVSGLGVINMFKDGKWHIYKHPQVPVVTATLQFLQTQNGDIWIGGWQNEVMRLNYSHKQWMTYEDLNFQCETKDKTLWFISSDGRVVLKNGDVWKCYGTREGLIDTPVVIKVVSNGSLWVAGSHNGTAAIAFFDRKQKKWLKRLHPDLSWGIDYRSALELSDGSVLFGSGTEVSGDGGFVKVEVSEDGEKIWQHIRPPLVPSHICSAAQANDDTLWFGGPELLNFDGEKLANENIPQELKTAWIDLVYCTPTNQLWVSKGGVGLFCYNGNSWKKYTVDDGLASNMVSSILYYDDTVLAATDKGISRFDGRSWTKYALPSNFKIGREEGILKKTLDGALWINIATRQWHKRGLTGKTFSKDTLPEFRTICYMPDRDKPETKITVSTKRVDSSGNATFFWEGIDYWKNTPDDQLQFSCRLDDKEWLPFASERHRIYFDLDYGGHKLEVRARDRDFNIDATPASVDFAVIAPVWRQPWFVFLMIGLISTIITLVIRLIKIREKHIKNALRLEAEKAHEIDMMKLNFFTNISHEFRTPLTLILGPLEKFLTKDSTNDQLQLMWRNTKRLLRLVTQLLDFRKMESGQLKLEPTKEDIVKFTKDIVNTFVSTAADKQIEIKFSANKGYLQVGFDPDKLEKIIFNLLSNALKFTPEGGVVSVEINSCTDYVEIAVQDNGRGISAENIGRIFERFYQAGGAGGTAGTGIGLALTKELVELHDGEISVESRENQGSRFTVKLPIEKQSTRTREQKETSIDFAVKCEKTVADTNEKLDKENAPIVLIIDDNADVRLFIRDEIGNQYKIIEAVDGVAGLEKAIETIPDLIVSDVMMPNMDGVQLCEKLKTDELTSHIPVILLTAHSSEEHKIEGLATGADDYITKPFSVAVLKARVHNLLESRRKLRERFSKELYWEPENAELSSVDKRFLQKAVDIVEKGMSELNFNAKTLADGLGMSRAQLYRKIKSVTDQTVNVFIRSLRLQRAAKLLLQRKSTVKEVGYEVGLFEPAHFTRYFREQFGQSPTEYIVENTPKSDPDQG